MAQEFDVGFKLILDWRARRIERVLAEGAVKRWLSNELPGVRNQRADLIGETEDGTIVHIEFQTTNSQDLPVRMAQYYAALYRRFGAHPRQVLVFAGKANTPIASRFSTPTMEHSYRVVDLKTLNGEAFLASPEIGDQILSVLMRLKDRPAAIRRVLRSIAKLKPDAAMEAYDVLLVISGLRDLEVDIEQEIQHMPLIINRLENKVLGREFKKGLAQGLERSQTKARREALKEGREEGRQEALVETLQAILASRFSDVPSWAERLITAGTPVQVKEWVVRAATAGTIREVFGAAAPRSRRV